MPPYLHVSYIAPENKFRLLCNAFSFSGEAHLKSYAGLVFVSWHSHVTCCAVKHGHILGDDGYTPDLYSSAPLPPLSRAIPPLPFLCVLLAWGAHTSRQASRVLLGGRFKRGCLTARCELNADLRGRAAWVRVLKRVKCLRRGSETDSPTFVP